MNSKTAEATVNMMKQIFLHHGIPNTVVADNMPLIVKHSNSLQRMGPFNGDL